MMQRSNPTPSTTPALPLDVHEEYDQAFRSKSFLDLWSHAHHHLRHTFSGSFKFFSNPSFKDLRQDDGDEEDAVAMEQSCSYTVLDDFVLEPSPEMLARAGRRGSRVETLLLEYFDTTQEACQALLAAIGAARRQHLTLRRLEGGEDPAAKDALARHVRLDNPLSLGSFSGLHEADARCAPLAARLAAANFRASEARACGARRAGHGRGHARRCGHRGRGAGGW